MESPGMWTAIGGLITAQPVLSIIAILIIILVLIGSIVFLVYKGKGLGDILGKGSKSEFVETSQSPQQEDKLNTDKVSVSSENFKLLLGAVMGIASSSEGKIKALRDTLDKFISDEQELSIDIIVKNLLIEYGDKVSDTNNLDVSRKILDLYLKLEISKLLKEEYAKVIDLDNSDTYSPEDINDKISRISERVSSTMKYNSNNYVSTIDKDAFLRAINDGSSSLKQNIGQVIKQYIEKDKETKLKISDLLDKRSKDFEERLKTFINIV
jgi:hypothetical protein